MQAMQAQTDDLASSSAVVDLANITQVDELRPAEAT
jgi:hypothetical protein